MFNQFEVKYYECHITIEPVFDERLELFKDICKPYGFRVADLLLKKRKEDTEYRSSKDSFCTGRAGAYDALYNDMNDLVAKLIEKRMQYDRNSS